MKILLAPHNDDEALFAAYTIMREHPLVIVVTDGYRLPDGVRYSLLPSISTLSNAALGSKFKLK